MTESSAITMFELLSLLTSYQYALLEVLVVKIGHVLQRNAACFSGTDRM